MYTQQQSSSAAEMIPHSQESQESKRKPKPALTQSVRPRRTPNNDTLSPAYLLEVSIARPGKGHCVAVVLVGRHGCHAVVLVHEEGDALDGAGAP